jgi:proline dehydrogenase
MWSSATAFRSYDLPVRIVDRLIATSLPVVPRPVVRRFAERYMAGERLDDAVATVGKLNRLGASATVDVLGEFVHDRGQAARTVEQYLEALDAIARTGLDATVSVKLTALGLEIDPALALGNVRRIVELAAAQGNFVRIDMEHSAVTD